MKIYFLVDCTKYQLPLDVDTSLKRLADRWSIPYQTARNRLSDGQPIRYVRARLEVVNVPKEELMSRLTR